jgi:hypothetical protein
MLKDDDICTYMFQCKYVYCYVETPRLFVLASIILIAFWIDNAKQQWFLTVCMQINKSKTKHFPMKHNYYTLDWRKRKAYVIFILKLYVQIRIHVENV